MILLALDLATSTGFSVGNPFEKPVSGTHDLPKTGKNVGKFLRHHEAWLDDTINRYRVTHVCFESPILRSQTSLVTLRKCYGLANVTEMVCDEKSLICTEANNSSIKKFVTGKGRCEKRDMLLKCREMGFDPQTFDEADAIGVWLFAVAQYDRANQTNHANKWLGLFGRTGK